MNGTAQRLLRETLLRNKLQTAQGNTDKKTYTQAFNSLMQLVYNFNKSQPKKPGH